MGLADPNAGELATVRLFVETLSFSCYSYVEPTLDMKQDVRLLCYVHMFEYFGGSTPCITCDNLKTGVTRHPREGGEKFVNQARSGGEPTDLADTTHSTMLYSY